MKRKILWVGLSCLLVASLVLASCAKEEEVTPTAPTAPTAPTTPQGPTAPGAPAVPEAGVPHYGGTLTVLNIFNCWGAGEPDVWDPWDAAGPQVIVWCQPVMEQAYEGDIDKYGPRGDNTYGFLNANWVDEPYYRGNTCESWEWRDDSHLVFHVRHGVYFTGVSANPGVMARRELTAEDFAYHVNRMKTSAGKGPCFFFVKSTYAEDKYTWVVEFSEYYSDWSWWLASAFVQIYPEEVVKAGARDWKNLVGTGPFTFTDYVRGSQATYTRNPDYWGRITIKGKEYQTPFIQTLVMPVIPDESTQIAALRTGKLDWIQLVKSTYKESLKGTNPDLLVWSYPGGGVTGVDFQCETSQYFSNENVRRAMLIGTDRKALAEYICGAGNYDLGPLIKGYPVYIPLSEMPESIQELYTYDAVKAKQMLADEGFPNGFTIEMTYLAGAANEDLASAYAAQWAKIGVTVNLKAQESSVYLREQYDHSYTDAFLGGCTGYPSDTPALSWSGGVYGHEHDTCAWKNDTYTNMYNTMCATRDISQRIAMEKEMVLLLLEGAPCVAGSSSYTYQYAWPWVKNYYGEVTGGYCHIMPMVKELWIDQDLKAEMGY